MRMKDNVMIVKLLSRRLNPYEKEERTTIVVQVISIQIQIHSQIHMRKILFHQRVWMIRLNSLYARTLQRHLGLEVPFKNFSTVLVPESHNYGKTPPLLEPN